MSTVGNGKGIIDEDALNIFTDGSSYPNKKRAAGIGIRFVWIDDSGHEKREDFAPTGWESATIDEVEIKACSEALKEAKKLFSDLKKFNKIKLFSDSSYVVNNFHLAINVWPKKKWLKSNRGPVANIELWKELSKEVHKCPLPVKIEWVKAHKSNIHNNAADKLAKISAEKPFNKPFSHSATTKKWSPNSTKRGSIEMNAQEIIIRIISRKFKPQRGSSEYRYEVIDSDNKFFQYIDFIYCNKNLSRNRCYEVRFNNNQEIPEIDEVIAELDCSKYKDSTD